VIENSSSSRGANVSGAGHAVVIGGSIAGMCAARVLSEVFQRVTVLDRDTFPDEAQHRKGVPQSRHPHALLHGGRQQLERLFPGFVGKMLAGGALELDPGMDMATLRADGWSAGGATPNTLLFSSRVLIESVIRGLSSQYDNVEYRENTVVTGLVAAADPQRVTGVRIRSAGDESSELAADLVVDASGRGTRMTEWLDALGLPAPQQTVVDADSGYSTRWYQGPAPADRPAAWWWRSLWLEPMLEGAGRPEEQYFGLLFPVEGDRWIVTTASWGGQELPRDPESFERTVANLRSPVLADAITHAQPISSVYSRRAMQNSWRHYERWSVELPGFIATGDATCGFNPVYGQGMTSAAFCAGVLERCLRAEDPTSARFARRFFREQAKFLSVPWMMATSRDRQQARVIDSDATDEPSRIGGWLRRAATFYLGQVALAGGRDSVVSQRLFEVINLSAHPNALLFDPRIVARVAWARLRQRLAPPVASDEQIPDHPPAPTGA
jgi:2-polyprenyl-6-methoxyphenol hydroxylase-like FAD-dependent oxidoreductase